MVVMPVNLPIISRGVPAYTNDDFGGAFPASNANNSTYGGTNYWRCSTAPVGGTDSGTLTQAVYLAYDLSAVSSAQRQNVVLVWYNDPATDPYNSSLISNNYYNVARDYTIDINTGAGGGSPPVSGWSTLVTVVGSSYHSRQHAINLQGANWVRINVTGINGSPLNNNVLLNMDIHDAHLGNQDNWIFFGDSITQAGLDHDDVNNGPILPAQIHALQGTNRPIMESGGVGGFTAADGAANMSTWLPLFSGQYVGLNYGTNDANQGNPYVANYITNMTAMISAVLAAGKTPVMHKTIPYGLTTNILTNGPTINTAIQTLKNTFPSLILGPDLWAYYQANQGLISGDNIHPVLGTGYTVYRWLWATALYATVYTGGTNMTYNNDQWQEAIVALANSLGQTTKANSLSIADATDTDNLDNITLIPSAAYTTTQTSADQTNYNARGVVVTLDVTDVTASPSVTLEIDMKDPVSGKYKALLTGAAVTTAVTNVYTVYPGAPATANVSANSPLPRTWRVKVTANNANSGTYSVGASLIV